jgi:hypothetical protein
MQLVRLIDKTPMTPSGKIRVFSRCEKPLKFYKTQKGFSQRDGFFEKPLGVFHSVKNPIW